MSTMIQGHRAQLAPGVLLTNVTLNANGVGNWNDMVLELKVDPTKVGAVDNLMHGLQMLIQGTHQVQQSYSTMTSSVIATGGSSAMGTGWVSEEVLEEIEGEMERDPEDIEDPVTLLTIRDLINERMDDMDAALRLAIGE